MSRKPIIGKCRLYGETKNLHLNMYHQRLHLIIIWFMSFLENRLLNR